MDAMSESKFQDTLDVCVEKVISRHGSFEVIRQNGENFVVVSARDWEQETLRWRSRF